MKKVFLAMTAAVMLVASPAVAQYYQGGRAPQYDDRGHDGPRRGYDAARRGYDDHRGRDDRRGHRPRMCVTSRGDCPAPGYYNPGQSCRCNLPGFGAKRGNVQ